MAEVLSRRAVVGSAASRQRLLLGSATHRRSSLTGYEDTETLELLAAHFVPALQVAASA